ncbi:MAG: PTS sugar transporter subunit IIB [Lachnospiraceae bacterium]|nr:PTS sugar transporter subunit IIB [Lachnospiraceae bacterium]
MGVCAIRIDERLIHGQVATLWQGAWNCHRIMVIDAKSANDPVLKSVLKIACPTGVKLSVLEAEKAAVNLQSGRYGKERITIVTKTPQCLLDLIDNGYQLECDITVGNMSNGAGKKRVSRNICVTEEDVTNFRRLNDLGYKMYAQMVPSETPSPFMPMLEEAVKA